MSRAKSAPILTRLKYRILHVLVQKDALWLVIMNPFLEDTDNCGLLEADRAHVDQIGRPISDHPLFLRFHHLLYQYFYLASYACLIGLESVCSQ